VLCTGVVDVWAAAWLKVCRFVCDVKNLFCAMKAMRGRIALQKHFARKTREHACSVLPKLSECARALASLFGGSRAKSHLINKSTRSDGTLGESGGMAFRNRILAKR